MYIHISIYRDVYYVYVPGHARAHTHDCTQAQAPTTSSGSRTASLHRRRCRSPTPTANVYCKLLIPWLRSHPYA